VAFFCAVLFPLLKAPRAIKALLGSLGDEMQYQYSGVADL